MQFKDTVYILQTTLISNHAFMEYRLLTYYLLL